MPELVAGCVPLIDGSIDVIICGIAVGKPVEKECIERKPPVGWRRKVCVVRSFCRVVERVDGLLILVEIVVDIGGVVSEPMCDGNQEADQQL